MQNNYTLITLRITIPNKMTHRTTRARIMWRRITTSSIKSLRKTTPRIMSHRITTPSIKSLRLMTISLTRQYNDNKQDDTQHDKFHYSDTQTLSITINKMMTARITTPRTITQKNDTQ